MKEVYFRDLEKRVDLLEPKPGNARRTLLRSLPTLNEDDQVCLARLIYALDKENISPENFEAWLSKRPADQQELARKILGNSFSPKQLDQGQGSTLTTEEANTVRAFWIHLHWTPAEAEEYEAINKRQDVLQAKWKAGTMTAEDQREEMNLSARSTYLAHDVGMMRVLANHALRDRVWPELAPRVLRWWKLTEKAAAELTGDESKELEALQEWFTALQREALVTNVEANSH